MNEHDEHQPAVDLEVLEDLGLRRGEQEALDVLADEDRDTFAPLSASNQGEILARIEQIQGPPLPQTLLEEHGSSRARSRVPRGVSYGLTAVLSAAAAAVLVGYLDVPLFTAASHAPTFETISYRGSTPVTHLAQDPETSSCLHGDAQVRIESRADTPPEPSVALDVLVHIKPETGPAHWVLHKINGKSWRFLDNSTLFFEGPLSSLAPLWPGDWTLDFHVGPRGACGPDPQPSCRKLPTVTIRVAPNDQCKATE